MSLKIFVLAKQVIDPEMPRSAFQVDRDNRRVVTPPTLPPVVNGFDENAVEASLRIKDSEPAEITVISMGQSFALDVMKKPLSMGADSLVLLQDDAFDNTVDSFAVARVLTSAIQKLGTLRPHNRGQAGLRLGQRAGAAGGGGTPGSAQRHHRQEGGGGRWTGDGGASDAGGDGDCGIADASTGDGKQRAGSASVSDTAGHNGSYAEAARCVVSGGPGVGCGMNFRPR